MTDLMVDIADMNAATLRGKYAQAVRRIGGLEARLNTMGQSYVETLKRAEQAEAELAALTEKCGKCPICNPGQRNLCGAESGAARTEEESRDEA
jgi:Zn-dependent alcohol dehydrogenase